MTGSTQARCGGAIRQALLLTCLATALLWQGTTMALEDTLTNAQRQLETNQPDAAYQRLRQLDQEHAGTVEYDYWLGVSALRAGHLSDAMLALQRVLFNQPRHAGARLELVATHLRLGQIDAASRELARLEALDAPPDAEVAMRRYRDAIEAHQRREHGPRHRARLTLESGYDSNAQRFPGQFFIDPNQLIPEALRPLVEEIELIELSRQGSLFQQLGARYQGHYPITDHQRIELDTALQSRHYLEDEAQPYNLSALQGQLGWRHALSAERSWRFTLQTLKAWHDTDFSSLLMRWGIGAEYRHPVGEDSRLRWHAQWRDNRFDQAPRHDHDSGRLGVELHMPQAGWALRARALVEREWTRADGAAARDGGDLNHYLVGLGADIPVGARQQWRLDLDHRWREYRDEGFAIYNEFEPAVRRDGSWEASVEWLYQLGSSWLLQASAHYEKRDSNIAFFDMHRHQARLGINYLF
ncbi:tetratricopeptide repeat protein [Billgrantia endophytica]|uniref:tetratricopeptide repeat protein n=1 Tax=Billgrantia endophytica TaxID=2033802 RepID=UPI001056CAF6|nr:tetratricopeptide repeat protein [Halomonas endophytica]